MNTNKPILSLSLGLPDQKKLYQLVALHGDMDQAGMLLVKDQLEKLVNDFKYRYFVLDFSDLNYIISESIGFLMALNAKLAEEKRTLVVVSAKAHVKDVLMAVGILSVFEYHENFEDFLNKLV